MDAQIRELERQAVCGDEQAIGRYNKALCRSYGHPEYLGVDQITKIAFSREYWQKHVNTWANNDKKDCTVHIQCVRCGNKEILVGHAPSWSLSSNGVITFNFATATNYSTTDCVSNHEEDESGFQQPYTWHPTKTRHWQKGNKKAKRRAKKLAKRRNR